MRFFPVIYFQKDITRKHFFLSSIFLSIVLLYLRIICEKPLSGNILQLNIATYYSRQCPSQNENLCKTQFQKQLKDIFLQILTIPITIQFDDNRYQNINIQLCRLKEMTGML